MPSSPLRMRLRIRRHAPENRKIIPRADEGIGPYKGGAFIRQIPICRVNSNFRERKLISMTYITHSPGETEKLGQALGRRLPAGTVLAYRGELGAGKTAFTRGLARGLGYTEPVTSPTYTIVNEYLGGRLPLFHFDMYRLGSSDDLWDIGWEDYLDRGGVCAVEWSENVADALEGAVTVTIRKLDDNTREITLEGSHYDDLSL